MVPNKPTRKQDGRDILDEIDLDCICRTWGGQEHTDILRLKDPTDEMGWFRPTPRANSGGNLHGV